MTKQIAPKDIVTSLMQLTYFDQDEAHRFLPNAERDQELRNQLIAISADDYVKSVPHSLRFEFCFVTLIEYTKANGCRYRIKRDISGGYTLLCYCEGIHYETIVMESFKDTETLINYLPKPHHTVIKAIKKSIERVHNRANNPSDFDQAMKQATY